LTPQTGGGWVENWTFYGAQGERLVANMQLWGPMEIYNPQGQLTGWNAWFQSGTGVVWFAGMMISDGNTVYQDRLGTNRAGGARFLPYGEEIGSTSNDRVKFATYTRDSFSGLDYANQRFYASGYGRFNTPDPSTASIKPGSPQTWHRYSYTVGDPVNHNDRRGLDGDGCDPGEPDCCDPDVGCFCVEPDASAVLMPDSFGGLAASGQDSCGSGGGGGGGGGGVSAEDSFLDAVHRDETDAYDDLKKTNCYKLLGFASAAAAQKSVSNFITYQDVQLGRLVLQNGSPAQGTPPPAQTSTVGAVYINSDYNWANFSQVKTSTGSTYNYLAYWDKVLGQNLTSEQLGTLIIIHEIQHNQPGKRDKESTAEKLAIYNDCVK
jgi:RHS repeat-associated protein